MNIPKKIKTGLHNVNEQRGHALGFISQRFARNYVTTLVVRAGLSLHDDGNFPAGE